MKLTEETDILRDMRPLDRDVFHYLMDRMDFKTGVIGKIVRISYGGIAYDLSEDRVARRKSESLMTYDKDNIRRSVNRLIQAGLLRTESSKGWRESLILVRVFYERLLGLGHCAKNPDATTDVIDMPLQIIAQVKFLYNIFNNIDTEKKSKEQVVKNPDATADDITLNTINQPYTAEKFSMRLDWRPTADEYDSIIRLSGFSPDQVNPVWIAEFLSYWADPERRGRLESQYYWTRKLAMQVLKYLRHPGLFEQEQGIRQQAERSNNNPKSMGRPEWARIPIDDEQLQPWAARHGYGAADIGWNYQQYRNMLRAKVEARLKQWRQLS